MADAEMVGILIMGGREMLKGFKLAGFETFEVEAARNGSAEVTKALDEVIKEGRFGLICIEERVVGKIAKELMARIKKKGFPVIVPLDVPLSWEGAEEKESVVARLIRRSIGYQVKLKR